MTNPRADLSATSMLWLWPVTVLFWCGLVIDTWLAIPEEIEQNATFETARLSFELALIAWLIPSGLWFVCSRSSIRRRIAVVLITIAGSLPILVVAAGQPGDGLTFSFDACGAIFSRRYFSETLNLSSSQLIWLVTTAVLALGFLNRHLGNIRLHRIGLPHSRDLTRRKRLLLAYRSENLLPFDLMVWETRIWSVGLLIWAAVGLRAYWETSSSSVVSLAPHGLSVALYLFLVVWCAAHLLSRWFAGFVLTAGVLPLLFLPWFTRIGQWLSYSTTNAEIAVGSVVWAVICVCTTLSFVLLVLTNQAPRRFSFPIRNRSGAMNHSSDGSGEDFPNSVEKLHLTFISSHWILGGVLWLGCCAFAFWLPRSVDPVVFVHEEQMSFPAARFSARVISAYDGERTFHHKYSEEPLAKERSYFETSDELEFEYPLFEFNRWIRPNPEHRLNLPSLDDRSDQLIEPIRNLMNQGILVNVWIVEPVTDTEQLIALLGTGASVSCSINGQHGPLPIDRLANPLLSIEDVYSVTDDATTWDFLLTYGTGHRQRLFVDCQIPADLTMGLWQELVISDCQFPPEFLLLQSKQMAGVGRINIAKLLEKQKLPGPELLNFLQNGGYIAATPPFDSIQEDGFPAIFVPVHVGLGYSIWHPSVRPMLLDAAVADSVVTRGKDLPDLAEFDSEGRLIALSLSPLVDCPAEPKWTTFPSVTHIRFTAGQPARFDNRRTVQDSIVNEELAFQVQAFPKLSAVSFVEQLHGLRDEIKQFVAQVLASPNLQQVAIVLPSEHVWAAIVANSKAERLVVDVSTNWAYMSSIGLNEAFGWVNDLEKMTSVKEILIVDPNEVSHSGAIGFGKSGVEDFSTAEREKTRQELTDQWTKRIHAVAPHLQVRIVDEIPNQ